MKRTCPVTGKVAYTSYQRACEVLGRMTSQYGVFSPDTLHVYVCPKCGKWHLGNRAQRARGARA